MLYERWQQIAGTYGDTMALHDVAVGHSWTFHELAREVKVSGGPVDICFPQGGGAGFILSVLRGWRDGQVVCPLEAGQVAPVMDVSVLGSRKIAHLKTTSATSGPPRLVAFTAEQLAADAQNVVSTMGLRSDWPNLGVISLAHSYGFSNLVTPLLLHGIPLILVPAPLPETVRQAAARADHITLPAVPAMWRAWHSADAIPPNVRLAISAGAPLPLDLERSIFEQKSLKIHNFYGASECGGIAYDSSGTPRTDPACVGAPMANVSLSVAEDGCFEVRSQAVAEMYLDVTGRRVSDSALQTPGCFRTSDLAELSDGQVFLRGRAGDQINVAGRKVSPEMIERVLLGHPQVSECLVFGVPSRDTERLEEIVAVVVSQASESALREFVLDALPAWQTPRHWCKVSGLQTNQRGKLSRAEWQSRWLEAKDGNA